MLHDMNSPKRKKVHFSFNFLTGQEVTVMNDIAWLIHYNAQLKHFNKFKWSGINIKR